MVTKPTTTTTTPEAPIVDVPAEEPQTAQVSPFEAAVLESAKSLNEYSSRVSAEVDKAQVWDDKLNPAMWPIRDLMAKLAQNAGNHPLMDAPVISDLQGVLEQIGSTADFRTMVLIGAEIAQKVQPVTIDADPPETVKKAESDMRGVLDNSLIALTLGEEVRKVAQAAIDAYAATGTKVASYLKASKRTIPSQTGTQGPNGASEAKGDVSLEVAFMSENGLSTYSTRNSPQEANKAGDAIKRKLAESRGFGSDLHKLPEEDRKLIMDTLRDLAENGQPGQMVQVPGIGTFTRK